MYYNKLIEKEQNKMIVPQEDEHIYYVDMSSDEYEVMNEFLTLYRNQSVIVADQYREEFDMVPLKTKGVILRTDDDTWKNMYFCRKIYHKRKPYVVELKLCHTKHFNQKHLKIDMFRIISNGRCCSVVDTLDHETYLDIMSIFDETKIISPEQPYYNKMYSGNALQDFLTNHEWQNIDEGIQQKPLLANSLFITNEKYEASGWYNYTVNFATILYQLINFRTHNLDNLIKDEKDLYQLDKLILKLSKKKLLKIQLHDQQIGNTFYPSKRSILLDSVSHNHVMHEVVKYDVNNTGLSVEQDILKKLVKERK